MHKLAVLTHIDYLAETGLSKRTELRENAREFAREVRALEALAKNHEQLEEGVGANILDKIKIKLLANIYKDISRFTKIKILAGTKADEHKRTADEFGEKIKRLKEISTRLEKVEKLNASIVVLALLSYLKTLVAVIGIFLASFGIVAATIAGFAKFNTVLITYFTILKASYTIGGVEGAATVGKFIVGSTGTVAKATSLATKASATGLAKYGVAHMATMAMVGIVAAAVISVALVLLSKLFTKMYLGKLSKADAKDKATKIANSSLVKAASKLKSAKA